MRDFKLVPCHVFSYGFFVCESNIRFSAKKKVDKIATSGFLVVGQNYLLHQFSIILTKDMLQIVNSASMELTLSLNIKFFGSFVVCL